jgi:hypothetical protein
VVYGAPKRMRFYSVCPSPVVYFELNKNKILLHPIVQPIPQVHVSPWVLKRSRSGARVSSTCLTLAQGLLQSVGSHILLALGGHGLLADLPVARGGRHRGSLHAVSSAPRGISRTLTHNWCSPSWRRIFHFPDALRFGTGGARGQSDGPSRPH